MSIDDELRQALRRRAAQAPVSDDAWMQIADRLQNPSEREIVGRPRPMYRGLVIAVAFALFAAAAVLVWNVFAPGTSQLGSTAGWETYRDPAGWTMRYPGTWVVHTFRHVCMADFNGAMVSNVPNAYHSTASATGCYWPPNMASLPPDGVVVEFDLMEGGPGIGPLSGPSVPPDTSFPLSLTALPPAPTPGTDVHWYTQRVQVNGDPRYTLNVWMGSAATEQDREIASTIVASIRPFGASPSTLPGTVRPVAQARCRSSQLTLQLGPPVSEATEQDSLLLTLTNISTHRCGLFGYPTVELLARDGEVIPFPYHHGGDQMVTDSRPMPVSLEPHQTAYVMINKTSCVAGDKRLARGVRLILPGETRPLTLAFRTTAGLAYCGPGAESVVDVSPFEARQQGTFAH